MEEKKKKIATPAAEYLHLISEELMRELRVFVLDKTEKTIKLAAVDPTHPPLRHYAEKRFGKNVEWVTISENSLAGVLAHCRPDHKAAINKLVTNTDGGLNGNIVELANYLITYGLKEKASDMHIEPLREDTAIRFRIDGILQKVFTLPKNLHPAIIARFKIMANLKIDEYRRPQDGRIELEKFPGTSLRMSTVPTLYGEKIAIRILNDENDDFSTEKLGFSKEHAALLARNIEKPFGMIVTSGPTGSGKTTTLYGLLSLLRKDGINISTLEDPIEHTIPGINQIQINPRVDLTFATGLRTLLRQDPDVIMVGEIRDSETAIMASNAALTGHLVLTTMHTNDAPSAFTRLLEMGVEDFVVGSIVNLVCAQRLVRRVCATCTKKQKLPEVVLKKIQERQDIMQVLSTKLTREELATYPFRRGAGCAQCLGTGYSGRLGIFELLELNKDIHDVILSGASVDPVRTAAEKNGFCGMIIDGMNKIFDGKTTFEELLRTTRTT